MTEQDLICEKVDGALRILLNRPEALNALTPSMMRGIRAAMEDAERDPQVRVIVFTGAGRGFCAGADVKQMVGGGLAEFRQGVESLGSAWRSVRRVSKPTIAAINGVAVGGGFELTLQCDLRLAAASARIGSAEVNMGQPMTNGSTYLLPRLIGEARAKQIALTGDLLTADVALEWGLVHAVAEDGQLEGLTRRWAAKLLSRAPIAMAHVKRCFEVNRSVTDADAASLIESEAATRCFDTDDQKEGIRAFLEKRDPRWSGR